MAGRSKIKSVRLKSRINVIILGAGAAGLMSASVLTARGCSVQIVEARSRIGGRIHTLHDSKLKIPIELGAEFVHGRPESTWKIIRQAGLTGIDLPFEHRRKIHGKLSNLSDIDAELAKVMAGLAHLGRRDLSFADYLRRQHSSRSTPEARQFALSFVEGFDAADPERISAKSIAAEQEGLGDVGEEPQFRLLEGYGSLIQYLHRSLDPKRLKLHLNWPASEIRWNKSGVEARSDKSNEVLRAARVLITLPIGVLQIPPESPGSLRFSPDIQSWRQTAMQLAQGPIVKAIFRFRYAFWEDKKQLRDISFLHNPSAPFPTFWSLRPLRVPILVGWAGGPRAVALAGTPKSELRQAALKSLAPLVGLSARRLADLVQHVYIYDWGSDPFSRGAYSYVTVGGMTVRSKLAKPIDDTLFFAGEALDTSGQASTVAGALTSGQRAAEQILSSL